MCPLTFINQEVSPWHIFCHWDCVTFRLCTHLWLLTSIQHIHYISAPRMARRLRESTDQICGRLLVLPSHAADLKLLALGLIVGIYFREPEYTIDRVHKVSWKDGAEEKAAYLLLVRGVIDTLLLGVPEQLRQIIQDLPAACSTGSMSTDGGETPGTTAAELYAGSAANGDTMDDTSTTNTHRDSEGSTRASDTNSDANDDILEVPHDLLRNALCHPFVMRWISELFLIIKKDSAHCKEVADRFMHDVLLLLKSVHNLPLDLMPLYMTVILSIADVFETAGGDIIQEFVSEAEHISDLLPQIIQASLTLLHEKNDMLPVTDTIEKAKTLANAYAKLLGLFKKAGRYTPPVSDSSLSRMTSARVAYVHAQAAVERLSHFDSIDTATATLQKVADTALAHDQHRTPSPSSMAVMTQLFQNADLRQNIGVLRVELHAAQEERDRLNAALKISHERHREAQAANAALQKAHQSTSKQQHATTPSVAAALSAELHDARLSNLQHNNDSAFCTLRDVTSFDNAARLLESYGGPRKFIEAVSDCTENVSIDHRRMLGQLVEHIGPKAYSDPSHFVLELLQNCDDANWGDAGSRVSQPHAAVELHPDYIMVGSNELGLLPKNVWGLAKVCASTKVAGESTGQKGLGFKSVYAVTSTPYVFSRLPGNDTATNSDWRFRFEMPPQEQWKTDAWKVLCPQWVGDAPAMMHRRWVPGKGIEMCGITATTVIYLPLTMENCARRTLLSNVCRMIGDTSISNMRNLEFISVSNGLDGGALQFGISRDIPQPSFVKQLVPTCTTLLDMLHQRNSDEFALSTSKAPVIETSSVIKISCCNISHPADSDASVSAPQPTTDAKFTDEPDDSSPGTACQEAVRSAIGQLSTDHLGHRYFLSLCVRVPITWQAAQDEVERTNNRDYTPVELCIPLERDESLNETTAHTSLDPADTVEEDSATKGCFRASTAGLTFPVYAVLPVVQCGLRVMINADWVCMTNREGITKCTWNSELRDTIARVLAAVLASDQRLLPLLPIAVPKAVDVLTGALAGTGFWGLFSDEFYSSIRHVGALTLDTLQLSDCYLTNHALTALFGDTFLSACGLKVFDQTSAQDQLVQSHVLLELGMQQLQPLHMMQLFATCPEGRQWCESASQAQFEKLFELCQLHISGSSQSLHGALSEAYRIAVFNAPVLRYARHLHGDLDTPTLGMHSYDASTPRQAIAPHIRGECTDAWHKVLVADCVRDVRWNFPNYWGTFELVMPESICEQKFVVSLLAPGARLKDADGTAAGSKSVLDLATFCIHRCASLEAFGHTAGLFANHCFWDLWVSTVLMDFGDQAASALRALIRVPCPQGLVSVATELLIPTVLGIPILSSELRAPMCVPWIGDPALAVRWEGALMKCGAKFASPLYEKKAMPMFLDINVETIHEDDATIFARHANDIRLHDSSGTTVMVWLQSTVPFSCHGGGTAETLFNANVFGTYPVTALSMRDTVVPMCRALGMHCASNLQAWCAVVLCISASGDCTEAARATVLSALWQLSNCAQEHDAGYVQHQLQDVPCLLVENKGAYTWVCPTHVLVLPEELSQADSPIISVIEHVGLSLVAPGNANRGYYPLARLLELLGCVTTVRPDLLVCAIYRISLWRTSYDESARLLDLPQEAMSTLYNHLASSSRSKPLVEIQAEMPSVEAISALCEQAQRDNREVSRGRAKTFCDDKLGELFITVGNTIRGPERINAQDIPVYDTAGRVMCPSQHKTTFINDEALHAALSESIALLPSVSEALGSQCVGLIHDNLSCNKHCSRFLDKIGVPDWMKRTLVQIPVTNVNRLGRYNNCEKVLEQYDDIFQSCMITSMLYLEPVPYIFNDTSNATVSFHGSDKATDVAFADCSFKCIDSQPKEHCVGTAAKLDMGTCRYMVGMPPPSPRDTTNDTNDTTRDTTNDTTRDTTRDTTSDTTNDTTKDTGTIGSRPILIVVSHTDCNSVNKTHLGVQKFLHTLSAAAARVLRLVKGVDFDATQGAVYKFLDRKLSNGIGDISSPMHLNAGWSFHFLRHCIFSCSDGTDADAGTMDLMRARDLTAGLGTIATDRAAAAELLLMQPADTITAAPPEHSNLHHRTQARMIREVIDQLEPPAMVCPADSMVALINVQAHGEPSGCGSATNYGDVEQAQLQTGMAGEFLVHKFLGCFCEGYAYQKDWVSGLKWKLLGRHSGSCDDSKGYDFEVLDTMALIVNSSRIGTKRKAFVEVKSFSAAFPGHVRISKREAERVMEFDGANRKECSGDDGNTTAVYVLMLCVNLGSKTPQILGCVHASSIAQVVRRAYENAVRGNSGDNENDRCRVNATMENFTLKVHIPSEFITPISTPGSGVVRDARTQTHVPLAPPAHRDNRQQSDWRTIRTRDGDASGRNGRDTGYSRTGPMRRNGRATEYNSTGRNSRDNEYNPTGRNGYRGAGGLGEGGRGQNDRKGINGSWRR